MPIKKFFQGIRTEKDVEHTKTSKQLEYQIKKINTFEVYMKRFVKVEERTWTIKFPRKG